MNAVEILIDIGVALLVISAATLLEPRLGVAAPLLLIAVGIGTSFLPFAPEIHVEPEWIIIGVLTPLLYSAAVSMPAMDFRREFAAIGALSVLLVVATALILGLFFSWVIPGLGLGWGIALGAIVSPTDAVAAPIIKRAGAPARVTTILAGESLFNDATALVLLRSAIAGAAGSVTLWGVTGNFAFAVAVAAAIGYVVGRLNLIVRARIKDATVNTVISFTVPFLAAIPAEELGASGLVAAGVAGLVTGHGATRALSPQHRLSDAQNWRTVEFILEGAVFLAMGLQLATIVGDVRAPDQAGLTSAVEIVAGALLLVILVRAAYVAPLLAALRWQAGRGARMKPRIATMRDRLDDPGAAGTALDGMRGWGRMPPAQRADRSRARLRRGLASIDHYLAHPLGWREGSVVVWAGMRGVITLAAAQTLPENTPSRSLLVLIAFAVATGSLLLQGGTLPRLVSLVKPEGYHAPSVDHDERARLTAVLEQTAAAVTAEATAEHDDEPGGRRPSADDTNRLGLAVIAAQRRALLDVRDDGTFTAEALNGALAALDADQISLELKGTPTDY